MSRNGSGTYSLPAGNPVVTGTVLSSTVQNNTLSDIATALTQSLAYDGQTTPIANLPMGGFKLTGLAAGTAAGNSVRYEQLATNAQDGLPTYLTSVSGTNTVTGTATPTPTYAVGQRFFFVPAVTNTGAATLNISSVGAGAVQWAGAALTGGELVAGTPVMVVVTAATPVFEIVNQTQFPDTRALVVGGTDATKKLRIEVDGLTTATTRVITMSDENFTTPTTGTSASTFTFDGSGGDSGSITMTYQKIGNWVTLNLPATQATTGTNSSTLTSNTALPAAIRPASVPQTGALNCMYNNGGSVSAPGFISIATNGIITIQRDVAGLAFTNSAVAGTAAATSLTYFVG